MNDHSNERQEHPRRHRPDGRRYRARRGDARGGFPGGRGANPRDAQRGFARAYRDEDDEFGGPGFGQGPGFGRPGFGGPGFGPGFGPGPHGRPGHRGDLRGRGGRGRARRGDVRAVALALLAEEPMNGYQIIQQIAERSGGLWQPSPGSVYPALAQLEDEGLIGPQGSGGGRRAYALTEAGRAYVAEHAEELKAPWSAVAGDGATAAVDMRMLVRQLQVAALGVVTAGTDSQLARARTVLVQARRALYRILAEDDDAEAAGQEPADRPGEDASQGAEPGAGKEGGQEAGLEAGS